MFSVIQLVGSLVILAAFAGTQFGRLDQSSYGYLIANAAGSAILAVTAIISHEWAFVLLEGVWGLVSLFSVIRKVTRRPARSARRRWPGRRAGTPPVSARTR
jgi:hypothetical protein